MIQKIKLTQNTNHLFFFGLFSMYFLAFTFALLAKFIGNLNNPYINYDTITGVIKNMIQGVIILPVLETLIFQALVYWLLKKVYKHSSFMYAYIFISALCFGLSHPYSITYFCYTFLGGIVLAFCYYHFVGKNAIIKLALLHGIFNLTLMIVGIIYYWEHLFSV